jgi:hypothetical protein
METLDYAPPLFQWPRCPEGERFVGEILDHVCERHRFARELRERMLTETGTRFADWVDHVSVPVDAENLVAAHRAGFTSNRREQEGGVIPFWHPHGQFPRLLLHSDPDKLSVALKVESVEAFLRANDLERLSIEGLPHSRYRRAVIREGDAELLVVERRAYRGFQPGANVEESECAILARARWANRNRQFEDDVQGMEETLALARGIAAQVGPDLAADVVLSGERDYWQSRNRAAQIQKQRQDALGLGWANHDHHTFRSSREHFLILMEIFRALGFKKRERYYAGDKAGWGAQVLEQPVAGFVIFADVDLLPEEKHIDFSREPLPQIQRCNTVGLWCGLHGESILQAGMHHLEAQFDFDRLKADLSARGIRIMPKFSDFPFLRQAFTVGERWAVDPDRLESLRLRGIVEATDCACFVEEGAVGSHLENLQRSEGYKGFNQEGVDAILKAVDPRKLAGETAGRLQSVLAQT